jgi:F420H(2)-dependent quinone reductase
VPPPPYLLGAPPSDLPGNVSRLRLQRPVNGHKFGMMRLTTIGRRSGRTQLAIVGYYEDGPNLGTLAMNG